MKCLEKVILVNVKQFVGFLGLIRFGWRVEIQSFSQWEYSSRVLT